MQPYRLAIPRVCKAATVPTRTMFTQPFFPHFNNLGSDFAPLFRMLDSATADLSRQARHTFTPRFDVREEAAVYQLQGEVPGFNKQDISLEILDDRTLVIRGRTESTKTNETAEAAEAVSAVENDKDNASEKSTNSYQKPSAEEEEEYVDAGAESEAAKTPASATAEVAPVAEKAAEPSRYWLNERSVGEFERRFNFPGRIELNNVKASLENGILSVVIPKAVKESRRIAIE